MRSAAPVVQKKKPAAGRRWQRARFDCGEGGGSPLSASASHLGGVDGRQPIVMKCLSIRQRTNVHSCCADCRRGDATSFAATRPSQPTGAGTFCGEMKTGGTIQTLPVATLRKSALAISQFGPSRGGRSREAGAESLASLELNAAQLSRPPAIFGLVPFRFALLRLRHFRLGWPGLKHSSSAPRP